MQNHHMLSQVPCWKHLDRDNPFYQISLTLEGHISQHNLLYRIFGQKNDRQACHILDCMLHMTPEAAERKRLLAGSGKPHPDQVKAMQRKGWEKNSTPITLVHKDTGAETTYPSLHAAARAIGGSPAGLCMVRSGQRKSHKGYYCAS